MAGFARGIGKPKIQLNYGQNIGKVQQNIRRKVATGKSRLRSQGRGIQRFGYGR